MTNLFALSFVCRRHVLNDARETDRNHGVAVKSKEKCDKKHNNKRLIQKQRQVGKLYFGNSMKFTFTNEIMRQRNALQPSIIYTNKYCTKKKF